MDLPLLFAELSAAPHLHRAACADPIARELFDQAAVSTDARDRALQTCAQCPALRSCRSWVEGLPGTARPDGVVGGLVIRTRRTARGRAAVKADGGEALKT